MPTGTSARWRSRLTVAGPLRRPPGCLFAQANPLGVAWIHEPVNRLVAAGCTRSGVRRSAASVVCQPSGNWRAGPRRLALFTGHEGLPYDDITTLSAGRGGEIWLGTQRGAIRFDGHRWQYRMAPRWLPDNRVRDIAVAADGNTWLATAGGVGLLEGRPMTLAEKWHLRNRNREVPFADTLWLRELGASSRRWRQERVESARQRQ